MAAGTAALVISAVGLISGFIGSKKASKSAKREAREEARLEGLTTDERLRQLDIEERAMYGQTLAGYAGSGVQAVAPGLGGAQVQSGSPQAVTSEQAKEFGYQKQITEQVGATKVAQSLARGKNVAEQYKWQGYSNAAGGIANMLTAYQASKGP
jgi:hypothetical protein